MRLRFSERVVLVLLFGALLSEATTRAASDSPKIYNAPLPTGVRLDPIGDSVDLGSMPLGMALAPEKDKVVVVLSGWRPEYADGIVFSPKSVTYAAVDQICPLQTLQLSH